MTVFEFIAVDVAVVSFTGSTERITVSYPDNSHVVPKL